MGERKYFGTDGIRGEVGKGVITPEFVLRLGWAAGKVLAADGARRVLIGKDTRISGYMLESALEAGLSAAGVEIGLLGPMPTPAIAYLTRTFRAQAGIVISASHNPFQDNGIKFFSADGTKLPDETELAIEAMMEQPMTVAGSAELGKAWRIHDAPGRYIEFCKAHFPHHLSLSGLRVILDCAHGATYHIAPKVLDELGAEVITLFNTPDGLNINRDCGATDVAALAEAVIEQRADLGIAYDGDGDRVIMVDHTGTVVDGDELLYIMARDALRNGRLEGGVVGTQMSNLGLEKALQVLGVPFVRSQVGDRYVMEELLARGWKLGGEGSGHLLSLDHVTTGDGIVASLQVLAAMISAGMNLFELRRGMHKFPQILINIRYQETAVDPLQAKTVQQAVTDVEQQLGNRGRVLLRKSGTEPLIRVMVEGEEADLVRQLAEQIAAAVRQID